MKDMTVETLNFIILCMGLLFVMAGIFLIVGKLAGKRPASIAVGVLMIAWGLLCGIPESRSWMLARATDLEHLLEAMWAGLDCAHEPQCEDVDKHPAVAIEPRPHGLQ